MLYVTLISTYQHLTTSNVAEIILFCLHVLCFLCVCYHPKSQDGNARTKTTIEEQKWNETAT